MVENKPSIVKSSFKYKYSDNLENMDEFSMVLSNDLDVLGGLQMSEKERKPKIKREIAQTRKSGSTKSDEFTADYVESSSTSAKASSKSMMEASHVTTPIKSMREQKFNGSDKNDKEEDLVNMNENNYDETLLHVLLSSSESCVSATLVSTPRPFKKNPPPEKVN